MENLKGKIFITGTIKAETGLHIGGSSTVLEIGGIDNNVIKTAKGVPYIPGSSLKGKLRTLYAWSKGYEGIRKPKDSEKDENCFDESDSEMIKVFGIGAFDGEEKGKVNNNPNKEGCISRLIVRDILLDEDHFKNNKEELFTELELPYTEGKYENTIDRIKSSATPRQIERVPMNAQFNLDIVYNVFNEKDIDNLNILFESMRLLEDDFLGGGGTRGNGKIKFEKFNVKYKTLNNYKTDNSMSEIKSITVSLSTENKELLEELKKVFFPSNKTGNE